jgi:N-acetylneuraminate synthase
LRALFGPLVGLSDHSLGHEAAIAATALGAVAIEKHLTLSRRAPGPDSAFSLEPHEFADMVRAVRRTEAALRGGLDRPVEEDAGRAFRRSLFAVKDIRSGEPFTADNIRVIRPAHGLHPRHLKDVLRKTATTDIARGTPLAVGHIHDFKPQGSGS